MLAYIYIYTHTSSCRRESDDDRQTHTHTHTHTPMPTLDLTFLQTHTHIWGVHLIGLPGTLPLHIHTKVAVYWRFGSWWHTHPYSCPRLIACTNTYFSYTFTGAFPLHVCGVTRNLRPYLSYFISVRRVFLVEIVILQTVLWDIRAWSARFLVFSLFIWE